MDDNYSPELDENYTPEDGNGYTPEDNDSTEPVVTEPGNYYTHVITEKGLALLAKQQLGVEPFITRAVACESFVDEQELEQQTEITGPVWEMELGERVIVDSKVVKLPLRLMNTALESTALIRRIAVYALDPDEGEILYQLLQYSVPQPLPSVAANRGAVAVFDYNIDVVFANSEKAQFNQSPGWFLNRQEMNDHDSAPDAHLGKFALLDGRMHAMGIEFAASQQAQDTKIKLLEDTLITDIQDNKKIIVFGDLNGVRLLKGVYNAAHSRLEC